MEDADHIAAMIAEGVEDEDGGQLTKHLPRCSVVLCAMTGEVDAVLVEGPMGSVAAILVVSCLSSPSSLVCPKFLRAIPGIQSPVPAVL